MRFVLFGIAVVVLAVVAVVLIGWTLPAERRGGAERVIRADPEVVRAVILDVGRQPEWRTGIRAVTLTEAGWTETTERGEVVSFAIVEEGPEVIRLRFESSRGYHGTWEGRMVAEDDGGQGVTRLTLTESAVTPSPVGRILARLFFDPAAYSRAYLDQLQARVEGGE
jgi:hypothetical protein